MQDYLRQGLYKWARAVLLPSLYYTVDYNGEYTGSYDQGYLGNMCSWRLGPPKLRQLRVTKGQQRTFFCDFCYNAESFRKKLKANATKCSLVTLKIRVSEMDSRIFRAFYSYF